MATEKSYYYGDEYPKRVVATGLCHGCGAELGRADGWVFTPADEREEIVHCDLCASCGATETEE